MEDRKRIYIRDIKDDNELLKKLFEHNSKIQEEEYNSTWEDNMFWQEEDGKQWNLKGVDIKDNYSSFYLKIFDYSRFINNFNEFTGNEELQAKYKKAMEYYEERNNVDFSLDNADDLYDELEEKFEKACDEVIEVVEKMLHEYENISSDEVCETFILNVQENNVYEDLYFYEDDEKYILHEDISYTKDFD